jgi:hypothetical protein
LSAYDHDRYIIQTAAYQIYEVEPGEYHYRISFGKNVYAEGVSYGRIPEINSVEGAGLVIKLFLGCGSNCGSVQYFDVYEGKTSEKYFIYSMYSEYSDVDTGEHLIAYFDFPHNVGPKILSV